MWSRDATDSGALRGVRMRLQIARWASPPRLLILAGRTAVRGGWRGAQRLQRRSAPVYLPLDSPAHTSSLRTLAPTRSVSLFPSPYSTSSSGSLPFASSFVPFSRSLANNLYTDQRFLESNSRRHIHPAIQRSISYYLLFPLLPSSTLRSRDWECACGGRRAGDVRGKCARTQWPQPGGDAQHGWSCPAVRVLQREAGGCFSRRDMHGGVIVERKRVRNAM
ncbi:hypothetical protein DFH06DRAFT_63359 [Mycena polygramma]|nr:hypothetical protein DFH06DRAFT_63359 [Mycena polygramma]